MVPSSGRTYLLFPHYPAVQPVAFHLYGTTPVDTSLDSPCTKGYGSYPAFRFSANINNSSPNQSLGKNDFIYPALQNPTTSLVFHDQFAFRPSGSSTAAIITLLHKVIHLLLTNPYVIVIALDFSKAFDTVRHHTLLDKIAQLDLPDHIYDWLVNFFKRYSHQTKYGNVMSAFKSISASISQGSAIGPASYVVNGSDLHTVSDGNDLIKYADDT